MRYNMVIVGGGIAGLNAAWRMRKDYPDKSVALLESSSRLGGAIGTERVDGYIIEEGPESILAEKPETIQWLEELGLRDEIIPTSQAHRGAYVLKNGMFVRIPTGFRLLGPSQLRSLYKAKLLSWSGMVRVAAEVLVPRRRFRATEDESLAEFITRRFGKELLDRLVQPLAGGIYGADPHVLSMRATFPNFVELEQRYGSVIRGLRRELAASSSSGARYGLFVSLANGIGSVIDAVQRPIQDAIHTNTTVQSVHYDAAQGAWEIQCREHSDENGGEHVHHADTVLLAVPAKVASALLQPQFESVAEILGEIDYGSTTILTYAWAKKDIPRELDAFGFVTPQHEKRTIMASTWSSIKYPNRAPHDHVLLRAYVGGYLREDLCALPDVELDERVRAELNVLLGISAPPLLRRVHRYLDVMPMYRVGHLQWFERLESALKQVPGLALAGTAYEGVGIPAVVTNSTKAVRRLVGFTEAQVG